MSNNFFLPAIVYALNLADALCKIYSDMFVPILEWNRKRIF